jgi:hypothetical protein
MGQPQIDWPRMRLDLTAPEWYVLNYVGHLDSESFKLAIKELVVRGALRVEPVETRRLGRRRQRSALTDGPRLRMRPPPALAPVLDVYSNAQKHELQTIDDSAAGMRRIEAGVRAEDFAKAARKRFGRGLTKYVRECVLPLLSGAGLMTTAGGGISKRTSWTAAGRQAVDELDEWMAVGRRNFRPWMFRDPARAIAWASSGGAAVLLMNDFYPQLVRLGQFLANRRLPADRGGAEIGIALSLDDRLGAEAGSELSGMELSNLDLGFLATDSGGFDGLDSAFTAIDAGIGAGDFGGGGGGGDGGGGGG